MKRIIFLILLLLVPVFSFNQKREKIRQIYTSQLHVREVGSNKGVDVYKYQKAAGVKSGMPWCGSFVYWSFKEAGIDPKVKSPAIANSWFIDQSKIIVVRGENKKRRPKPGDVIGISYTKGRVGHVGFYDSESDDFYTTIEGNTKGQRGSKDGEGVHKLKRIKRQVLYIANYID